MRPKLNILHTESSKGWGGQEIRIFTEALGMISRGNQVMIAAHVDADILKNAKQKGIPVTEVDFNGKGFVHGVRAILRLIQKHNIDVVNTHSSRDSWIGGIAGKLSRRSPLVVRSRHLHIPIGKDPISRVLHRKIPHFIVTTGEPIRELILKKLNFPEDRVESIPTGIDLSRFDPSKPHSNVRQEYGIPQDGFIIGTIAVLRSWKGHEFLLEAARQLCTIRSDLWFLLVGDGPGLERYGNWVRDHGLESRIILTGYQERVPEILHSIDLFVLPSYANEGVPQALIQAMAMKKPAITCNVGGISEVLVDGKTGRFAKPKDPSSLASLIVELKDDVWQRRQLADSGFAMVQSKFSIETMLDRTEEIYHKGVAIIKNL